MLTQYALPGRSSGRGRVEVVIHVPVATALGISDAPGTVDRYGPISADTVRRLLPDARLRKACVDATTGRILAVDAGSRTPTGPELQRALLAMVDEPAVLDDTPEPRHDPSAALARTVRLRDPHCDGPGCSVPAQRCELDHSEPWPHGPTNARNLRPRSQRCHHAKHTGWTVTTDPDGTSHWISPAGRTYTVPTRHRPPPAIRISLPIAAIAAA